MVMTTNFIHTQTHILADTTKSYYIKLNRRHRAFRPPTRFIGGTTIDTARTHSNTLATRVVLDLCVFKLRMKCHYRTRTPTRTSTHTTTHWVYIPNPNISECRRQFMVFGPSPSTSDNLSTATRRTCSNLICDSAVYQPAVVCKHYMFACHHHKPSYQNSLLKPSKA